MAEIEKSTQVKALTALLKNSELQHQVYDLQKSRSVHRMHPDQWLEENEREWFAMDRLLSSRPWATRKDEPFRYPFRKASNEMRKEEGPWIGDENERVEYTRGEAPCDIITQVQIPPEFPVEHRMLLFTPEFGSDKSFDMESWSYIEPEDKVDIWVICWQGWTDFNTMVAQVAQRCLSFADGANTVWFGQGMGAIVAYEVLKLFEGKETPNLPVTLVVADCPAPHLFAEQYKPKTALDDWDGKLNAVEVSAAQRRLVATDLQVLASYKFKHGDKKRLQIPISACCHEEDKLAAQESVQAWDAYAKEAGEGEDETFELVEVGEAEECDDYLQGQGYAYSVDPTVLGTLSEVAVKYCRYKEQELMDYGPTDGPIPSEVDCVVVGGGITGLTQARFLVESGKSLVVIEKTKTIGGVWSFYGNQFSRVNTSEVGYRIYDKTGQWNRCNEDHTPRADILHDVSWIAHTYCYGKIRHETEVIKVDKLSETSYEVTVKSLKDQSEHKIKTKAVSIHVNRRIGQRREVRWEDDDKFRGKICYGYANEASNLDFWDKKVLIVGAGAFAFENVRTALEHGARHVTLMGRRDGTTCPKWVDCIAFLRPLSHTFQTKKSGDMISFACWQDCYTDAGLHHPSCWKEGLLKPNNHTISVSDIVFIASWHGMAALKVGEIARIQPDGMGVECKDGSTIECDIIIKCTGFHLNEDVEKITGFSKMQPNGLLDFNLNYGAEPLLDGAQFGSSKDKASLDDADRGFTQENFQKGLAFLSGHNLDASIVFPAANPFGSGQGGPVRQTSLNFQWLVDHPEEQKALLEKCGAAPQNVTKLWSSEIGNFQVLTSMRIIAAIGEIV
jgi:thioredoxin reductase